MKKLYLSLYVLMLIALIGLGWAIDSIYQSVEDNKQFVFPDSKQIFLSYKEFLDDNPSQITRHHPQLFKIENAVDFILPFPLNEALHSGEIVILNSTEGITFHQYLKDKSFVLSMGPIQLENESLPWLKYSLTLLFYFGIALILLFWVRPLLKDIGFISHALNKVSIGQLDTRLEHSSLYLSELFSDFNQMSQKLEILNENNQLFSQAVSHDIRTPLSRILFALEDLEKHEHSDVLRLSTLIREDVSKVEILTKELLHYSRLESTPIKKIEFDPVILVDQVIAGFDHFSVHIDFIHDKTIDRVQLDADLLQKILNNLLSNAVRFCERYILVRLTILDNILTLVVSDDGQGIDFKEQSIESLCQPFVQKKREDKHFGLGLAIVLRATKLMHGQLVIDRDMSVGGARFTVTIPL